VNILYIGHYRENSSFGYASRKYVEALHFANVELSIRPIYLQRQEIYKEVPDFYHQLENNKSDSYDILIQDTIPQFYEYNKNFGKNICVPKIETRSLSHTGWIERINMMDEVWVNSFFSQKSLQESGVTKTIKVAPIPFNLDQISNNIADKVDKEFNFYTITSMLQKDNLLKLLTAYFLEFNNNDNVRLIVKLKEKVETSIRNIITQAYNISRKSVNKINEPIIINGHINEQQMIDLHNNSDCYIDASSSSYAGMGCVQAALYGNQCICTNGTAPSSFISNNSGFNIASSLVDVISEPVYGINNIYTNQEKWYDISIQSLRQQMRAAYQTDKREKEQKLKNFNKNIFDHKQFKHYI